MSHMKHCLCSKPSHSDRQGGPAGSGAVVKPGFTE